MNSNRKSPPSPLSQLRVHWVVIVATQATVFFAVYSGLSGGMDAGYAKQWAGQTAVILTITLATIWKHLPENHRIGETAVLPTFGLGNHLTILRGLLISMLAGFLLIPQPIGWLAWLPALLYTIASIADILDGYAARVTNHATALGARLDMTFDGLGILIVISLAVWYKQLPLFYLIIGLARYFFLLGLWLREKQGLKEQPLSPSIHRRVFAGLQMGFLSVVLWPILPTTGVIIAALLFGSATAVSFLRDWFVVIDWLDPQSPVYTQWQRRVYRLFSTQLPPLFRLIFAVCALILIITTPINWATPFVIAAAVAIIAGAMGRVMALWLLFPLAFDMLANDANIINSAAIACVILIALLGTGAYSLWQPEDRFLYRRAGE